MYARIPRTVFVLMVLGAMAACASTPSEPPQGATSIEKTAVAAAPPAATPAAATSAAEAPTADGRPVPAGFKRMVRNGEEYFCQSRKLTGSRARTTEVCFTRDDLHRMEQINNQYWKNAGTTDSQSQIQMDSPN